MSTKKKKRSKNDIFQDGADQYYPVGFKPRETDVIVGKGLNCYHHAGNKMLRDIIASRLDEYAATTRKKEKSIILQSIMAQVRNVGEFVQKDFERGLWYNADNFLARDKVSQTFRNILAENTGKGHNKKRKQRTEDDNVKNIAASCDATNESSKDGYSNKTTSSPNHLKPTVSNKKAKVNIDYFDSTILSNPDKMKAVNLDNEGDSLESIDYPHSPPYESHWSKNDSSLRTTTPASDFKNFLERYASSLTDECFEDPNPYEPNAL